MKYKTAYKEQCRVNMHDDPTLVRFSFQTSSPIFDKMIHLLNDFNTNLPHKNARCTYGHYFMIREAYELGYERVLFIEDDIRFLKDVNSIERILDSINFFTNPEYNVIMYDWCLLDKEFQHPAYILGSCYSLNRYGMLYFLENYEVDGKYVCDIDQNFCVDDFENLNGTFRQNTSSVQLSLGVSNERICVQTELSKYRSSIHTYEENMIDFSLYNL